MRAIHRPLNWRLRCLRSRYAYCPAFITASLAMLKTLPRRPRKPLAFRMIFLCLACAVTPRLTLGMAAPRQAYGSIARTCFWSVECTSAVPRRWRLFLVVFFVRIWRLNAWERLMLPPERILKRFAALRLVLSLGIALLLFWHGGGRLPMEALYGPGHHFFCAASRQDATAGFGSFLTGFAAGFFTSFLPFFGASTITSCRPSIFGYCSTTA